MKTQTAVNVLPHFLWENCNAKKVYRKISSADELKGKEKLFFFFFLQTVAKKKRKENICKEGKAQFMMGDRE